MLAAAQDDLLPSVGMCGGIQSSKDALPGRFLIAGRSVDLACQKEPIDPPRFERRRQLDWIDRIVLDGIAKTG